MNGRESSEARDRQKFLMSIESRVGKVLMKMIEPIMRKILDHTFIQVGEHGVVYAAWVEDLPKTQETIRGVAERIREYAQDEDSRDSGGSA